MNDRELKVYNKKYLKDARKRHKNKGFDLEEFISTEDAYLISKQKCFYCDEDPILEYKDPTSLSNVIIKVNGLDRIDSGKGYVKNNIVPCCPTCNKAKNDLTVIQFYNHVEKMHKKIQQRMLKYYNNMLQ